jgi:hypothetical protein
MSRAAGIGFVLACVSGLLWTGAPGLAQEDFGFMPKGGRTLLADFLGGAPKADEIAALMTAKRSEEEWRSYLAGRKGNLTERELRTLASYLAINAPWDKAPPAEGSPGDLIKALPPDGRDLAWNYCQSCHSLFSSYLTQERDLKGWLGMFSSPFHRGIDMTPKERQTFSAYSAINMPMKIEDVPADLRF